MPDIWSPLEQILLTCEPKKIIVISCFFDNRLSIISVCPFPCASIKVYPFLQKYRLQMHSCARIASSMASARALACFCAGVNSLPAAQPTNQNTQKLCYIQSENSKSIICQQLCRSLVNQSEHVETLIHPIRIP